MLYEEDNAPLPRTALDPALADELRRRALDPADAIRLTLARHQGLGPAKASLRPLTIAGKLAWQLEENDGRQVAVRNFAPGPDAESALDELLSATGAREYHLAATGGDLHVRITRKGRALISRGRPTAPAAVPAHDREKDQPLARFDSAALLRVIGLSDGNGEIRASMRGKADQINAFLRELDALLDDDPAAAANPLSILDCGCGRAYLTLAAHAYLSEVRGLKVAVRGVDRNAELIGKCTAMAEALDVADDVQFAAADIADCAPDIPPDLVLSLHACDTATDLAIAAGVRLGASKMLVAPCCQHDLQKQIRNEGPQRALLRHGILRERLADILTDAFRAQLLRVVGYRVRISEFVSPEATARNILLRAVKGVKAGQPQAVAEYLDLRDEWRVVPVLEEILGETVRRHFR